MNIYLTCTIVQALRRFYANFNGDHWIDKTNWHVEDLLCTEKGWFGVSCYVNARNTSILDIWQLYVLPKKKKNNKIAKIDLIFRSFSGNNLAGPFHTFTEWNKWDLNYLWVLKKFSHS